MAEQLQMQVLTQSQIQSDSYKLKLNFIERALQKAKDQNAKLILKIHKLHKQNQSLKIQAKSFNESLTKKDDQLKKKEKDIQSLVQKLQVRTRRHESQQSQNLSKNERQQIQRKIKRVEQYSLLCKSQKESYAQKCKTLAHEIQQLARQKAGLLSKIQYLTAQSVQDSNRIRDLEKLYQQKIKVLQSQKSQLRRQNESLTLQMKLAQRKKQIQGLLDYEHKIGKGSFIKPASSELPTYRTNQRQSFSGDLYCRCEQLQQQLWQAQQLISLLKQRNIRLLSEVESVKKRCNVLQGIICSASG